jgi:hypothetical protein
LNERNRFVSFNAETGDIRTIDELDRERIVGDGKMSSSIIQLLIVGTPACLITVSIHVDDGNND